MSVATLDISNADYFMVIVLLHGRLYFSPCSFLTMSSFEGSMLNAVCLEIKDSCLTSRNRDEIFGIGDCRIEEYNVGRTGADGDCVMVDNLIDKMYQASTDQQSQADNDLIQTFMGYAILRAITNSRKHLEVNDQVLKSWIYVIVTPTEWGKRVASDAFFSLFEGSGFITPANALVMPAFDALLHPYLHMESFADRNTLPNSKNIICELSVGKAGDASVSMNIFSVARIKGHQFEGAYMTIDTSLSVPTLFYDNRINMNAGYRNLVELFRYALNGGGGLDPRFYGVLLRKLCSNLSKLESHYQEEGSQGFDQIYPFEAWILPPFVAGLDISALRRITLEDIYTALSPQCKQLILDIKALLEKEVCITRIFFTVIPESPSLYPEPVDDVLFISILLTKLKLEASTIKKYKYLYNRFKRIHENSPFPFKPMDDHLRRTVDGVCMKLIERQRTICEESLPLQSLPQSLNDTSPIKTINYVYLFTNQVFTQSVSVNENGTLERLSAQKSDIITLDQFLVMDDAEVKTEEVMLQLRISESALSLLESRFPTTLQEFAMLYRQRKEEHILEEEENVANVSCLDMKNWYHTLHTKYEQLFHSEAGAMNLYYTKIMTDLVHLQSESGSPRILITQQKHVGTFLMVYFGYLKETLTRDFGPDTESTRYILLFEQLMRNVTIGQVDGALMRKALDQCKWVPETEKNKRKLMVYDIEDNFPIPECLQRENIAKIPVRTQFAVITVTRYYVKTCQLQALEDILPTDTYCKTAKNGTFSRPIDFYAVVCEKIWHYVLESVYETDSLLEYPPSVDIMDLEFTLESYNSFKVAFSEYILNVFPFRYENHCEEEHRFSLHLKQGNCSIVLTNRLVLLSGVIPAFEFCTNVARARVRPAVFLFYRLFNFDDEKNPSLPMLRLLEVELKKFIEARFMSFLWISMRQFASVHSHHCLRSVHGDTAFGYEALKTGVIRAAEGGCFALDFQYFDNDTTSSVEVINNQSGTTQLLQGTKACIVTRNGAPCDNTNKHNSISTLTLKFPHLNMCARFIKINDTLQRNIGDVVAIQNYDHTILSTINMREVVIKDDIEEFMSFPFVNLLVVYAPPGYMTSMSLVSHALKCTLATKTIIRPLKLAYFDSYEEKHADNFHKV